MNRVRYPLSLREVSQRDHYYIIPILETEVVKEQKTDVDMITGATLTVTAYRLSLGDALRQARGGNEKGGGRTAAPRIFETLGLELPVACSLGPWRAEIHDLHVIGDRLLCLPRRHWIAGLRAASSAALK